MRLHGKVNALGLETLNKTLRHPVHAKKRGWMKLKTQGSQDHENP
jgi:hypothetical protein